MGNMLFKITVSLIVKQNFCFMVLLELVKSQARGNFEIFAEICFPMKNLSFVLYDYFFNNVLYIRTEINLLLQ